ncbi:MAG: ZIP family metal transporter [Oscillospiraceae bacterium]|jgi:ZIP family zinc transporter|nr:ZIP family metal transporter [Oscillospiraceae bacterium]
MEFALITAAGVGGATVVGAAIGFCFRSIPHKFNDVLLSFAAGVMLAAAMIGLILPSIELGGSHGVWITLLGIFCGAVFLNFADRFVPHLHNLAGVDSERHSNSEDLDKILLFVLAIAIHNMPEGIAAGVAAGQGNTASSASVTIGIMLQNVPEGMIVVSPLLAAGVSRRRAFSLAAMTGVIEVIGTIVGYFAVRVAAIILPFALAFAGGTMLYVVGDEMIPETHAHGFERAATYMLLVGFSLMLMMDFYL